MNGSLTTALLVVFAASTIELSGSGGVLSPWVAAVVAFLVAHYSNWLPKPAALQGAILHLVTIAIGFAVAQWFAPLGVTGVVTGATLLLISLLLKDSVLFISLLSAVIGVLLACSIVLFSLEPSWLFQSTFSGEMHHWVGFSLAIGMVAGLFSVKEMRSTRVFLFVLGLLSISAVQLSMFYEQGDGTPVHLVCFLMAGCGGAFSATAVGRVSRPQWTLRCLLFGAYLTGSIVGDVLNPFWWAALFPLLCGYALARQGVNKRTAKGNVPAVLGVLLVALGFVSLAPYPGAGAAAPLAVVAVACVIVIERAYREAVL